MQYLKRMMYLRLIYSIYPELKNKTKAKCLAGQILFRLVVYADSNYAGDLEYRKLVIRPYFFIHSVIVF